MTRATLLELERRLVEAEGFDPKLRDDLLIAFGWKEANAYLNWTSPKGATVYYRNLPNPILSIDAAKSGVPEGCGLSMVEPEPEDGKPYASIYNKARGHIARGSGQTLPIAVNLAWVRARLSMLAGEGV